jgi:2-polyprenyl-6-methoxyphenol hydroxylase-like FAD-dependent oxidoreductase
VETAVMDKQTGDAIAPPMVHTTDVAIVGGGLAGSLAAAMLGRAGIDAILIDPHTEYPPDFRCEKLDGEQVALLEKPAWQNRFCALARRTGKPGSPASAAWSRSAPATSTAPIIHLWSMRSAPRSRATRASFTQRRPRSRPAPIVRPSHCRPAILFRRA